MDIEGTYTLQARREDVWHCLMDQQVLRRAIPGVRRLEVLDENRHGISLEIQQTPLIGVYHGQVTVTEREYPVRYHIAFEGEGRQSTISGQGVIQLSAPGENTVVTYKGTVNLGKLATLLPPPVVKGAAKLLIQQFFMLLAEQLRVMRPAASLQVAPGEEVLVVTDEPETGNGTIWHVQTDDTQTSRADKILRAVVRRLKLGGGDIEQENVWIQRTRRYSMVAALLFLVWVGTRIPRR